MKISIITPLYNEEEIVIKSICETFGSVNSLYADVEYLIVNDGSIDNTLNLVLQHFNHPPFKILNKTNGGFGSAVKYGVAEATGDYILCVPADSPLDVKTSKALLDPIKESSPDIIVTYRKEKVGYSSAMRFNSMVYHKIVSILFLIHLKDYNWIHVYRRTVFNQLAIQSEGIFMLAEALIKAKRLNQSIIEVEVEQRQRISGIGTSTKLSAILNTLCELLKFKFGFGK